MKIASGDLDRYFGSIYAIEKLNVFKVDIQILDIDNRTYQPILNLNLAPCAYSTFLGILETYVTQGQESKVEHDGGYVSLQTVSTSQLGIVNFASVHQDSVSVNYSVVNQEISNLILQLSKDVLGQDPEFTKDCT